MESLRGKLLIASPALVDPNFHRSVVLIAAHDEQGALGLVLNRPSQVRVADAVEALAPLAAEHEYVYVGGPVAADSVMLLAQFDDVELATITILGDVGLPRFDAEPEELASGIRRARCFAGHAGWGPGQLDAELEAEAWIVEQLAPDDLWVEADDGLWGALLRRKGGEYALLARMPLDPSVN
jgi:putative transcriptional regulator